MASPFASIQAGIDAAAGGDLVLVGPGVYVERIDLRGKAIEIRGAAGPSLTVLDANQSGTAVLATSGERAVWGIVVRHAGGDVIYQREPARLLHPASNMKILTLAAAAERLGWDFRFETVVQATAPLDSAGTVRGDVVVVGGGDPTISRRHDGAAVLAAWAEQLWRQGVRRVQGRVIGDGSRFGGTTFGDGWQWDDFAYGYAAPVNALSFNENTAEILVTPGATAGALATLQPVDTAAPLAVRNEIRTAASETARRISIRSSADDSRLTLDGEVPLGYEPFSILKVERDPSSGVVDKDEIKKRLLEALRH